MTQTKIPDLELCTGNLESIRLAERYGYKRIELCIGIEQGGLTPGPGLVKESARSGNIEIHVLLRHRSGDFIYDEKDLSIFISDMEYSKNAGATGVVTGCLLPDGTLNQGFCSKLAGIANQLGLEITFHRAFDFVRNPEIALEQLISMGFHRILTSGGKPTALEGLEVIAHWLERAAGRIEIMAGSGVHPGNAAFIASSGVDGLHYTAEKRSEETLFGMGPNTFPDEKKIRGIMEAIGMKVRQKRHDPR
jgi:copper homeostasis protein